MNKLLAWLPWILALACIALLVWRAIFNWLAWLSITPKQFWIEFVIGSVFAILLLGIAVLAMLAL